MDATEAASAPHVSASATTSSHAQLSESASQGEHQQQQAPADEAEMMETILQMMRDVGHGVTEDELERGLEIVKMVQVAKALIAGIEMQQVDAFCEEHTDTVTYIKGTGKGLCHAQKDLARQQELYWQWVKHTQETSVAREATAAAPAASTSDAQHTQQT